jgi:hypothetical protein
MGRVFGRTSMRIDASPSTTLRVIRLTTLFKRGDHLSKQSVTSFVVHMTMFLTGQQVRRCAGNGSTPSVGLLQGVPWGKPFTLTHFWGLIKDCPKWQTLGALT